MSTTTVNDNDLFVVEDNSDTKKITMANLRLNLMTFPTTKVPSSNPNTLDDYEEGTFTPTVTSSGGTLTSSTATGRYTKIGNMVSVAVSISITNHGTGTGELRVTLPFTSLGDSTGVGREVQSTGVACVASVYNGSSLLSIVRFDGVTIITTNRTIKATIVYFTH